MFSVWSRRIVTGNFLLVACVAAANPYWEKRGWYSASINGVTYLASTPADPLPDYWMVDFPSLQDTRVTCGNVTVNPRNTAMQTFDSKGTVVFKYTLHLDASPSNSLVGRCILQEEVKPGVSVFTSNCSAKAKTEVHNLSFDPPLYRTAVGQDTPPTKYASPEHIFVVPSTGWTYSNTSQDYVKDLYFESKEIRIFLKVTRPIGGGTAATASGIARYNFHPLDALSSTTGKFLYGVTDTCLSSIKVDVETYLNVPVVQYSVDVSGGDFELPLHYLSTNLYNLYFSVPGGLRKKVAIDYDNTTDITGVDASLLWGDLDGDNYVSLIEVNAVYALIGSQESDGDSWMFDLDSDGYFAEQADFDLDGEVTSADYNLAVMNVGVYGD